MEFAGDDLILLWVVDRTRPECRFVVEILADGRSFGCHKAETFVAELYDRGCGDGCYGVYLALDPQVRVDLFELVLCNNGCVLAALTSADFARPSKESVLEPGKVAWRGGLRLSGTVRTHNQRPQARPHIEVYEGAHRLTTRMSLLPGADRDQMSMQFDLLLPPELADGEAHLLRVSSPDGEFDGSPLSMLAHRGGFQCLLDEALEGPSEGGGLRSATAAMLDALLPASLPFGEYRRWEQLTQQGILHSKSDETRGRTVGVFVIGREALELTIASLRAQIGDLDLKVALVETEAGSVEFTVGAWQRACATVSAQAPSAYLVVRSCTELRRHACLRLSRALLDEHADAEIVMADHGLVDRDGRMLPLFMPVFDEERLLSQGYGEGLFGLRKPPSMAGAEAALVSSYDVLLRSIIEATNLPGGAVQVPEILADVPRLDPETATPLLMRASSRHLASKGVSAEVSAGRGQMLPAVQLRRARPEGEVAIIIPTRDRLDLLKPCIASIRERTIHPDYRIVIVDNGSREPETFAYLDHLAGQGITIFRDDKPFNHSRLNNEAVARISAPFICFLNNDVEILSPLWLDAMQRCFARADVGGVGAKLIWPNGMLQHGGVVLGMNFAAGHAYDRYLASEPGYADGIVTARECSALTAACMMVRRSDFEAVGGFDAQAFPVAFNDVDLCLKLRRRGRVLIWTPQAELLHHESASRRGDREHASKSARADKELAELRNRWGDVLMDDPYYNPNLNLDAYAFTGLALPPRSRLSRRRQS